MSDEEQMKTIYIPGQPRGVAGGGRHLGELPTQVLTNTVVGRLTIIDGPGSGESRAVFSGSNQIGRGAESKVQLDFGDNTISRTQHAVIVCDPVRQSFTLVDGGKQNPVTVNGERVTVPRLIAHGDTIKIGLTTMRFSVG
jgi:pSer/pThr/pTyr-binding forkhead associated (FHA) protein